MPAMAHAQTTTASNSLSTNKVLQLLQTATASFGTTAADYGIDLLIGLASISFVIQVSRNTAHDGGFYIQSFFVSFVWMMVYVGFWYWFLKNWSGGPIGQDIIKSFTQAGSSMSGVDADPAKIMAQGLNIFNTLITQIRFWKDPGGAFVIGLCAICILALFLIIGLFMILAIAKAYVAILIGGMAMGFAGLPETRAIAFNAVFTTVGAGARMMMLQILAGMGNTVLQGLAGNGVLGTDDVGPMLALLGVWAVISYGLPALAEAMFGGHGYGSASPMGPISTLQSVGTTAVQLGGGTTISRALGSAGRSMMVMSAANSNQGGGNQGGGGGSGTGAGGSGTGQAPAGARMRASNARFRGP